MRDFLWAVPDISWHRPLPRSLPESATQTGVQRLSFMAVWEGKPSRSMAKGSRSCPKGHSIQHQMPARQLQSVRLVKKTFIRPYLPVRRFVKYLVKDCLKKTGTTFNKKG